MENLDLELTPKEQLQELIADSAGEVETMNFSIRELRNFELGNC